LSMMRMIAYDHCISDLIPAVFIPSCKAKSNEG
jgi:hypothetical protein